MKDKYAVELTVRDTNGAILSVIQHRHAKYLDAFNAARTEATNYATKYGFECTAQAGGFFTVHNSAGVTYAQTAIRY